MDEFFFRGRFVEVMIGSNDFYSMAVCLPDEFFYQLVSGEEFHIDEIHETTGCQREIQFSVSFSGNFFFAAFLCGAEGKKKRKLTESRTQSFCRVQDFFGIKNILKPVSPPFHNIDRKRSKSGSLPENVFFRLSHDRNADLWTALADGDVSYLNCFHRGKPHFLKYQSFE